MFDSLVVKKLSMDLIESKLDLLMYTDLFFQKFVLKLELDNGKSKQKAMKTVSGLSGTKNQSRFVNLRDPLFFFFFFKD